MKTYAVYDMVTGAVVGRFRNLKRARTFRDRKDWEYGACRYLIRLASPTVQTPGPRVEV